MSQPQLLAGVPPSGQALRAGGTLEEGPLAWRSFRFADQRPPHSPGEQKPTTSLCKTGHERVPILQAASSRPSHLFGEREESECPLHTGQGVGRSHAPRHQPPAPGLSPKQFRCIIDLPLTPMVASSCKHFRPVTFILKTNKTPVMSLPDDPVYSACTVCGLK